MVRGVAADPSVIRLGEDFYLATSTFDMLPGVVLRHSTDLVNWRIIGAAVNRPAQYRRDRRPGPLNLFAPTLRYADGRFHVACTNVSEGQGNFLVSADDIAGEWSDAVWVDEGGFDPSLLYDDGIWYYTRRTLDPLPDGRLGPIVQAEIDVRTGRTGPLRELTPDWGGFCSNDIEGPHLYRIGDWYYLFSAEGGTWKGHMQTCARSRSPWGPFQPAPHNPVLTHRHRVGHPIQSLGHAELVDDPAGNWWALSLGTRHQESGGFVYHHNLGREVFLTPVAWSEDGWPVIGSEGTTELEMVLDRELPGRGAASSAPTPRRTLWNAGWSTVVAPDPRVDETELKRIALPFGDGLDGTGVDRPLGLLLTRQTEDSQVFTVTVDQIAEGGVAGVAVYTDGAHHYSAILSAGRDGRRPVLFERVVDDLRTTITVPLDGDGAVAFRVDASPQAYRFTASVAGSEPVELGQGSARLLSAETSEGFTGVRFGLVAIGDPGSAGFGALFSDPALDGRPLQP